MTLAKLSNGFYPSVPSLMERFLDGNLDNINSWMLNSGNSTPAVNVIETENEFKLEVALPGVKKDDVSVEFDNGVLTIASKEKEAESTESAENIEKSDKYYRKEFGIGAFKRTFKVAKHLVNSDEIKASQENGILYVTLPKREEVKPKPVKQIEVQ